MTINEKIKELRKIANLTQEALAAALNISYQSFQNGNQAQHPPTLHISYRSQTSSA